MGDNESGVRVAGSSGRPGTKFKDIIERIEFLRAHVGLTKSAFARRIGVKVQTYNNFTGLQGSKPNVELLHGLVTQFGAHPMWLLSGAGPMFLEGVNQNSGPSNVASFPNWAPAEALSEGTREVLSKIGPVIERIESAIQSLSPLSSTMGRVADVLRRYAIMNPSAFEKDALDFIARIEEKITVN